MEALNLKHGPMTLPAWPYHRATKLISRNNVSKPGSLIRPKSLVPSVSWPNDVAPYIYLPCSKAPSGSNARGVESSKSARPLSPRVYGSFGEGLLIAYEQISTKFIRSIKSLTKQISKNQYRLVGVA